MNKRVLILGIPTLVVVIGALVNLNLPKIEAVSPFYFANVEALTGEYDASGQCRSVQEGDAVEIAWRCDCPQGKRPSEKRTKYVCAGSGAGECSPGNVYEYLDCDGHVTHTDSSRSIAFCPSN